MEFDDARADYSCTNCGFVVEDSAIVSEIQFQDSAAGVSSAVGSFVPSSGVSGLSQSAVSGRQGGFGGRPGGPAGESRELSVLQAKRIIRLVGNQLKLNEHVMDSAQLLYKLALQNNFVQGRSRRIVVGAAVYIVCRREKTPHMLLDVAEALQEDMYSVGKTYLRLASLLGMKLPLIDPSLYIHRFASLLEFGARAHLVGMTALRLVARMKRDWIQTGRRPAGICGACLLIAARLHGFQRNVNQVATVVKMHHMTISQRMKEFSATPTSQLTLEEFQNIDLQKESDPPAFVRAQAKRAIVKKAVDEFEDEEDEFFFGREEDEDELEEQGVTELELVIEKILKSDEIAAAKIQQLQYDVNLVDHGDDIPVDGLPGNQKAKKSRKRTLKSKIKKQDCSVSKVLGESQPRPARSSFVKSYKKHRDESFQRKLSAISMDDMDRDDFVVDMDDDDEISSMIIANESELKLKETFWMAEHKGYLKEREERQRLAEIESLRVKRPYTRNKNRQEVSSSAGEAAAKVVASKTKSSKINYEALQGLLNDPLDTALPISESKATATASPSESFAKNKAPEENVDIDSDLEEDEDLQPVDADDPRIALGYSAANYDDDFEEEVYEEFD